MLFHMKLLWFRELSVSFNDLLYTYSGDRCTHSHTHTHTHTPVADTDIVKGEG